MYPDKAKIDYLLDIFSSMFNNYDHDKFKIGYTKDVDIIIKASEKDIDKPFENPVVHRWLDREIPFIFNNEIEELFKEEKGKLVIGYDILIASFYFLSGIQERNIKSADMYGRVIYLESINQKLNCNSYPIVNYYFDILKTAIEKYYNVVLEPKFQNPYVVVSHDIDKCSSGWLEDGFLLLKKFKLFSFLKLQIQKWLLNNDPWFNFKDILEKENTFNIKSTFFFLAKKGGKGKFGNSDYRIGSKKLNPVFKEIENSGSEIGIHGSFGTSTSLKEFLRDINKLQGAIDPNIKINGNRFHFLSWLPNTTPKIVEESKLSYDMSAAFAENSGFKNGICFPFRYFNFEENRAYSFAEIPLIVMDTTLFSKKYMQLDDHEILRYVDELLSECFKFNGIFTLLWHNTHFTNIKYARAANLFEKIIALCKKKNSNFITANSLVDKWKTKR